MKRRIVTRTKNMARAVDKDKDKMVGNFQGHPGGQGVADHQSYDLYEGSTTTTSVGNFSIGEVRYGVGVGTGMRIGGVGVGGEYGSEYGSEYGLNTSPVVRSGMGVGSVWNEVGLGSEVRTVLGVVSTEGTPPVPAMHPLVGDAWCVLALCACEQGKHNMSIQITASSPRRNEHSSNTHPA